MTPEYNGTSSRQTGDINLAAALMACAIPLDEHDPVRVIEAGHLGKPYGSFRVTESSADGKHTTEACMGHWSGTKPLADVHPFATICRFIEGRPPGKLTADEWLGYAIDYLRDGGIELPGLAHIEDIPAFVATLPSAPESYILAFVYNRWTCNQLYKAGRRSVFQERKHPSGEVSRTLIDSKLPEWQRRELLSRLQG